MRDIEVEANGKTFTFPDGTDTKRIGEAVDAYFKGTAKPAAKATSKSSDVEGSATRYMEERRQAVESSKRKLTDTYTDPNTGFTYGTDPNTGEQVRTRKRDGLGVSPRQRARASQAMTSPGGAFGAAAGSFLQPMTQAAGTIATGRQLSPEEAGWVALTLGSPPQARQAGGAAEGGLALLRRVAMEAEKKGLAGKLVGKTLDLAPTVYQKVAKPVGRMQEDVVVKKGAKGAVTQGQVQKGGQQERVGVGSVGQKTGPGGSNRVVGGPAYRQGKGLAVKAKAQTVAPEVAPQQAAPLKPEANVVPVGATKAKAPTSTPRLTKRPTDLELTRGALNEIKAAAQDPTGKNVRPVDITLGEWARYLTPGQDNITYRSHRAMVEKALSEGVDVPANVLADYPDLAPTKPTATPVAPAGTKPTAPRVTSRKPATAPATVKSVPDPVMDLEWVTSAPREKQAREAASRIQAKLAAGQKPTPADYGELPPKVGAELAASMRKSQQPTQSFASGLDPRAVVEAADNLDIPPARTGSFTVERPPKDAGAGQQFRSPLSIVDATGKTIQSGYYERLGGEHGKAVSQSFRAAQKQIDHMTRETERTVSGIEQRVLKDVGRFDRKGKATASSDFIDLIERDKTDPLRKGATPEVQAALEDHDRMTDQFREYIVKSRRELGVETPDDWGITEKGYFRHLFLGDIQVFDGAKPVGLGRTYADAQKIAMDYLKAHPDANLRAKGRDITWGDPTLRVSNKRFWKTVGNLADSAELSKEDILEDIRGVIGQKAAKQKFFGALMRRKGAEGFSRAYGDVMRLHGYQVARTQELSKLNRAIMPVTEKFRAEGLPGLADHIEGHLQDLWGTPSPLEQNVGRMIQNIPVLRNHVANPAMALRQTVRRLTGLQSFLKLDINPKSAIVNLVQPSATLWPYTSTKEFAGLYKDYLKPSVRNHLREVGVFEGATKIEGGGMKQTPKITSPFRGASNINRGIGYLFGERQAKKAGLPPELVHENGLAWAEKVEFDNSQWNAPPILRTPQGRLLGQFKGFTAKQLETLGNMAQRQPGEGKLGVSSRLGKFGLSQGVVGGVNSAGLAAKAAGGYAIYKALESQLKEAGFSPETAEKTATAVFYGAPSLLGADLSGSVAVLDEPYGKTTREQFINFFGGPTVDSAIKLWDGLQAMKRSPDKDKSKVAVDYLKKFTPASRAMEGAGQYIRGEPQTVNVFSGGKPKALPLNKSAAVLRAMGFTPVQQSKFYDELDLKRSQPNDKKPTKKRTRIMK